MNPSNAILLLQIVLQNLGALQAFASTIQKASDSGGDITDEDIDRAIVNYRSAHATLDAFIGAARAPATPAADVPADKPASEQPSSTSTTANAPAAGEQQTTGEAATGAAPAP